MSSENSNIQLKENIIVKGYIEIVTGLHIGGNTDSLHIGGVDLPVIKDPKTGKPLVPGSSLKGKMRSSLEYLLDLCDADKKNSNVLHPHASKNECKDPNCPICTIFGSANNNYTFKSRLIVRDGIALDDESTETEFKVENVLDRLAMKATPRTIERVPAGTIFPLELVYSIYDKNDDRKHFKLIFEALKMIEHSYLGGHGTRGYGKVKFHIEDIISYDNNYYKNNGEPKKLLHKDEGISPSEVLKELKV